MSKGLTNLMKQAQQMQAKIVTLQKELDARVIDVSSGGGMVKISGWLIRQHQLGIGYQGTRYSHSLFLATGDLVRTL